jgi:predicted NBD/HSP70 family sugar kinase
MDQSQLRDALQLIYSRTEISRARLAQELNLVPSYVSLIVRELLRNGSVREQGTAPSSGGRPGKLLQINPELAYLIGIDIGTVNCRMIVTDFLGNVRAFKKFRSRTEDGPETLLHIIHQEVHGFRKEFPKITALGLAQSGVVDRTTGTLLSWPKVDGWHDVPLKAIMEEEHGLHTIIEESAVAEALAEQRFGQGRGLANFVHVLLGAGIGATIFVDGKLYIGTSGMAGEWGHTTVDETGPLCSCGNRGCLEVYSSASAIVRRVRAALADRVSSSLSKLVGEHPEELSVEMVVNAAKSGDRLSQTVLSEAGMYFGRALAGLVNLLSPQKIILGGSVPRVAGESFHNSLQYFLRARAFQRLVGATDVVVSELDEKASALGVVVTLAKDLLGRLGVAVPQAEETSSGVDEPRPAHRSVESATH